MRSFRLHPLSVSGLALVVVSLSTNVSAQFVEGGRPAVPPDSLSIRNGAPVGSKKSPGTALALGVLIPGGGHFYAGETETGAILLAGSVGAMVAGLALSDWGDLRCQRWLEDCAFEDADLTPLAIGSIVAAGLFWYGVIDAPAAARRANGRNGWIRERVTVTPGIHRAPNGLRPGLSVSISLD